MLASAELENLPLAPIAAGTNRYKLELGRAERLFGAKRYGQARAVFEGVRSAAHGDDHELVNLRLAECDYFLKRPRPARDGSSRTSRRPRARARALYFYAVAVRDLGDRAEYQRLVRRLVDEFPDQSWAEEGLNNLATHYILESDDDNADATFREMYEKFPVGHYAERAAWKIGWRSYRNRQYADTIRVFESAAAHFPRSDYRPSWLYWSARSHDAINETVLAEARYTLIATDYRNSYYGRSVAEASRGPRGRPDRHRRPNRIAVGRQRSALPERGAAGGAIAAQRARDPRAPSSWTCTIRRSTSCTTRRRTGAIRRRFTATIGWISHERGDLRAGINAIKRAYPQYLAVGGEKLPNELLKVLFPVDYWPLIRRYSTERQLDPYMIAALIAQESTFTADVKSPANAYGLMQLLPSTGRQYAKAVNKRYSLSLLTTAETNIRMGTAYFADLVRQFGAAHYALATYNAGPSRVAHWMALRPGIDRDEFIDDIPFPETQAYVKKILGTAEDYRRLYGPELGSASDVDATPALARPAAAAGDATASATPAVKKKPPPAKKKTAARKTKKST